MNVHSFTEYIKYRLKAKTRHGIHSPFVYAFIDNCLGSKSSLSLEERINAYFGKNIKWVNEKYVPEKRDGLLVLGIKNIHVTAASTVSWNELCTETTAFAISIDLYSIGLLVHNPDIKEKQHFVLKYPL